MTTKLTVQHIFYGILVIGFIYILGLAGNSEAPFNPNDLPPCPTEDSDNCYWDGGSNGQGAKFYVIEGEITYVR